MGISRARLGTTGRLDRAVASLREESLEIAQRLELERVPAGIEEEHRRLFPDLPLEAHVRLDEEVDARAPDFLRERRPLLHAEHHAKVTDGNGVAIDGVRSGGARLFGRQVGDNLMAEEVEVDPIGRRASLRATQELSVESTGLGEARDGKCQVKRRAARHVRDDRRPFGGRPAIRDKHPEMIAADRDARLRTARMSPEIANRHDQAAWLALYTEDAVVEDPFGTPPCRRGTRTRGGQDDLERFYATFIAPASIRIEERLDVVVGNTVIRDVVLHVRLAGGGQASIPAFLEYELDASSSTLRVRRMRAYWDARRNGRAMMAQGVRGKLTSLLSMVRLLRHFGRHGTRRYLEGTKRGVRRDGPAIVRALVGALVAGDRAAVDAITTKDATLVLPGRASRPLAEAAGTLKLEIDAPICSGFMCVSRCRTRVATGDMEGIAFVEVDASSKRVASLRLFWED